MSLSGRRFTFIRRQSIGAFRALELARSADVIVKASGVGVFDELLESEVPALRRNGAMAIFWDVDAPATLDRLAQQSGRSLPLRGIEIRSCADLWRRGSSGRGL